MHELKYLTPPQYAKLLGVSPDKVLSWLNRGELRGIDVSQRPGVGRARWRIPMDAIEQFEASRAATVPPKKRKRKQRDAEVLDIIR